MSKGVRWVVDGEGRITNFDLKLLRQDIVTRLQTGANLYTLEECRMFIVEMTRVATAWQEEEFASLLYLNQLHQKVLPGRKANYQWPITATPNIPFAKPCDAAHDAPLYRINKVVEELNRSLVRMVDRLWNDRRERLLMGARILKDIESTISKEA